MFVPYTSITNFTSREQVDRMREAFLLAYAELNKEELKRKFGVGVMMSFTTLNGVPSIWHDIFPKEEQYPSIFSGASEVEFLVLHYADFKNRAVEENLLKIPKICGPALHAIQLDMTWPEATALAKFREHYPEIKIILQVGKVALELAEHKVAEVVTRLGSYGEALDGVLLDQSMGHGDPLKSEMHLPYLREISARLPNLSLVIAGGLGPTTMELVWPILSEFPDVSFDAEGKVKLTGARHEPIYEEKAVAYLWESAAILRRARH